LNQELLEENNKLKRHIGKDEIVGEQEETKEIILEEPVENQAQTMNAQKEQAMTINETSKDTARGKSEV
jgi:hypothetical protein